MENDSGGKDTQLHISFIRPASDAIGMRQSEINKLITDMVDEIDSPEQKQFIREILAFERSKMDLENPHYKDTYQDQIEKYALTEEEG